MASKQSAVANATDKMSSNNLTIVMVLISLLVLGLTGLAVKFLWTDIVLDTKVVKAKAKAGKQITEDVDNAPKLMDAYGSLGATAQTLESALPNTVDFPSILVVTETMAGDAGVRLKTVTPGQVMTLSATTADASVPPVPQTYRFSMSIDGTYEAIQRFLSNIEKSARPMRVVGVRLSGSGSSMSSEVDVETFFQDKAVLPFAKETIK